MSKKILFLCGSPNKSGNTNTVASWVAESAQAQGATVEIIDVTALRFQVAGCNACMACQKSSRFECVIADEISEVLKRVLLFNVIVFATPVYFFNMTAQLKIFMDRMFCLDKIDLQTGKFTNNFKNIAVGLIATAGGNSFRGLLDTFKECCRFGRQRFYPLLIPLAGSSGDIRDNPRIKKKAAAFGQKLARY